MGWDVERRNGWDEYPKHWDENDGSEDGGLSSQRQVGGQAGTPCTKEIAAASISDARRAELEQRWLAQAEAQAPRRAGRGLRGSVGSGGGVWRGAQREQRSGSSVEGSGSDRGSR